MRMLFNHERKNLIDLSLAAANAKTPEDHERLMAELERAMDGAERDMKAA
jgi:hypothetical protein